MKQPSTTELLQAEQKRHRDDYRKQNKHGLNDDTIKAAAEKHRKEREFLAKNANQYGYLRIEK